MANGTGGAPPVPLSAHHGDHLVLPADVELPGETRFDYLFRDLDDSAYLPKKNPNAIRDLLNALGDTMVGGPGSADSIVPTVYTYWGQFVDHDLTLNTDHDGTVSDIDAPTQVVLDPKDVARKLKNARLPQLNLDSVYGPGSQLGAEPSTMAVGQITVNAPFPIPGVRIPPGDLEHDLPRTAKARALIADARNDENLAVAQLHTAFLRFHNNAVRWVRAHAAERCCSCGHATCGCGCERKPLSHREVFERARDLTRLAYQWVTVHDYLANVTNAGVVQDALTAPRLSVVDERGVFMPLEFSVAAFRFGHSMIRSQYDYNRNFGRPLPFDADPTKTRHATLTALFQFTGRGANPMLGLATLPFNWVIEWDRWVDPGTTLPNRLARKIDTRVSPPLKDLPGATPKNLAGRNLVRGYNLAIPTGQAVATILGEPALNAGQLTGGVTKLDKAFHAATPLWFYILKEAEVLTDGNSLGPVGGRIVAETIVGQVRADPASYLNRWWTPQDGVKLAGGRPVETIQDFLRFAGVLA